MTRDELISDLRERINPAYADQRGTESYERKLCADALEAADKRIAELEAQLSQTIAGFDVRQATRIGELLAEQNESERKLAKLESENAAQIAELHAISVALGTSEGHSSVQHIEALHEKLAVARNAMTKAATLECNGVIRAALAQIGGDDAGS